MPDSWDNQEITEILNRFSRPKDGEEIYYNLCLCLMVPLSRYKVAREVLFKLKEKKLFLIGMREEELEKYLKPVRFYRTKTRNILRMSKYFWEIVGVVKSDQSSTEKREWLVENISGMGYKAASHFLRNMGATDLAIIDIHILRYLGLSKPPTSRQVYLSIEKHFASKARSLGLTVAELDAKIWKERSHTEKDQFDY